LRAASRAALALLPLLASCATPRQREFTSFEAMLGAQDSATVGLSRWCAHKQFSTRPAIRAERIIGDAAPPPRDLARLLALSDGSRPGYRHVRLSCGGITMSEAHNWYVPARLTERMNDLLDHSDTPFGTVAAPTGFVRQRLDSAKGAMPSCPRGTILSHRALLRLPDGSPLALVIECYAAANLASPRK
jgi:hypothetical protein